MAAMQLTRTHRILIGVVIAGAVIIAGIGFAGSYAAVRELAVEKGFGNFSYFFPIGIDAGICVLLSLDLLLTWIRIPFPLLRQAAWVLTAATIAFNGAAAWPDPLGVGMHAVIPLLFIVAVEAARHAVGRIADITADKHMEGVRLTRWVLSPVPTFKLWRRMKLWELRSYEQVIKLEQDRLIYQSRLQARFGRNWRRKAPIESLMPLRLAKYGVPLADTAPSGLAAAGIDPMLLPAAPVTPVVPVVAELPQGQPQMPQPQLPGQQQQQLPQQQQQQPLPQQQPVPQQDWARDQEWSQEQDWPQEQEFAQENQGSPWFAAPQVPEGAYEGAYNPTYVEGLEPTPVMIPQPEGPEGNGRRPLRVPGQRSEEQYAQYEQQPVPEQQPEPEQLPAPTPPDDLSSREETYFTAFRKYVSEHGDFPNARQFGLYLQDLYGFKGRSGGPLSESTLRGPLREFRHRYQAELDADADDSEHIA
ncbi:membrane protein [Streptomyces sp. AcH 505]|uniref:DUF2637 domain-containing protein n=1 Tax=Streptomyces sp. AcH 505 TaxID=352211 RepID=UPI000591CD7C|nr:membrane protein [Streptomyces sp. AcH 505]